MLLDTALEMVSACTMKGFKSNNATLCNLCIVKLAYLRAHKSRGRLSSKGRRCIALNTSSNFENKGDYILATLQFQIQLEVKKQTNKK